MHLSRSSSFLTSIPIRVNEPPDRSPLSPQNDTSPDGKSTSDTSSDRGTTYRLKYGIRSHDPALGSQKSVIRRRSTRCRWAPAAAVADDPTSGTGEEHSTVSEDRTNRRAWR